MYSSRFREALLLSTVLIAFGSVPPPARAQRVAAYRFLASEAAYTPLTDGIQVLGPDTDDALSEPIPIGFPFSYAGQDYDSLQVSSNGFIRLGDDGSNAGFDNDLASTGVGPLLAPLWDDLSVGSDGVVRYQLSGQAPGRVLTIGFASMRWDSHNDAADATFQVQLYESGSEVAFVYGALGAVSDTSQGASIGLSNGRAEEPDFLSVTPANAAMLSSTVATNDIVQANFLPAGTTYRFMPPLALDLEVRSLNAPSSSHVTGSKVIPRVSFRNTSLTDYSSVGVKYEMLRQGMAVYSSTRMITDFLVGETREVSFNQSDELPAGDYRVRAVAELQGDQYAANDTLEALLIVNWGIHSEMFSQREGHTATALQDGRVLVAGGYNGAALAEAEIFDPAVGTWQQAASMETARLNHTATLLNDGRVLVAGGRIDGPLPAAELYDPATDTWTATPPMDHARHAHTATLLPDGRVLVVGGYNQDSETIPQSEVYDPASDTWTTAAPLPGSGRAAHAAVTLDDGRILILGGEQTGGPGTECYLYDSISDAWSPTAGLRVTRVSGKAVRLSDGRVLMTGGYPLENPSEKSVEIYDPATEAWTPADSMLVTRQAHTISLLSDGKVLVTGGSSLSGPSPAHAHIRSEVFDPATGAWTFAGNLEEARYSHSASVLPDGSVLVAGGVSANSRYRSSAERYDYPAVLASTPVELQVELPDDLALLPNYPNPFNPATTLTYTLAQPAEVTLAVFDLLGRRVRTLVEARQGAGAYEVRFDGSGLPSGLYLYRLQAGHQVRTRKMMLVK